MNRKIKVLIADDHAVVRMGLASLLSSEKDIAVVGQCEDGEAAVREAERLHPDVVIMDLVMPKKDGVVATDEIHRAHPEIRIVLLTTFGTSDRIARALEVGASGALLKSADESLLIDAVRSVAAGGEFIDENVRQLFADDPPAKDLTPRQRTILEALAAGRGTKEIGPNGHCGKVGRRFERRRAGHDGHRRPCRPIRNAIVLLQPQHAV